MIRIPCIGPLQLEYEAFKEKLEDELPEGYQFEDDAVTYSGGLEDLDEETVDEFNKRGELKKKLNTFFTDGKEINSHPIASIHKYHDLSWSDLDHQNARDAVHASLQSFSIEDDSTSLHPYFSNRFDYAINVEGYDPESVSLTGKNGWG